MPDDETKSFSSTALASGAMAGVGAGAGGIDFDDGPSALGH